MADAMAQTVMKVEDVISREALTSKHRSLRPVGHSGGH
jgi:hypothetical protein